jgi:hypothetical protein
MPPDTKRPPGPPSQLQPLRINPDLALKAEKPNRSSFGNPQVSRSPSWHPRRDGYRFACAIRISMKSLSFMPTLPPRREAGPLTCDRMPSW